MSGSGTPRSRRSSTTSQIELLAVPASNQPGRKTPSLRQQQQELGADEFMRQHMIDCESSKFSKAKLMFYDSVPKTFAKYDTDNSGHIDASELQDVLKEMGYELSHEQMMELLNEVDVDNTGTLDLQEFTVLLELWLHAAQFKVLDSTPQKTEEHIDSSIFGRVNAVVPDVPWRWAWELLVLITLTYFWMSVTCSHVFELGNRVRYFQVILVPDIIGTIVLLLEMAMKMNMAVLDDEGKLLDKKSTILMHYFRSWFWLDFMVMFPFRWVTGDPFPELASNFAFVVNHFRLLGVLRMPSMFQSSGLIKVSLNYVGFHFTFMPYFWLVIFFFCSLTACMAVNVQFFRDEIEAGLRDPADGHNTFAFITYWTLYIMAGVGYGDVAPLTDNLRAFASFQFLFSFVINGYFIGAVAGLMAEDNIDEVRHDKLAKTRAVLDFFKVPVALSEEILQYQSHLLHNDVAVAHPEIVAMMPEEIRSNIVVQSRVPLLKSMSFFDKFHQTTLVRLAERLVPSGLIPEEGCLFARQRNKNLFIINYGFIDVVRHDGTYYHTLRRGDYFGETALLKSLKDDAEGVVSSHTFVALNYCDMFILTPEGVQGVMKIIPRFATKIRALAVLAQSDFIFSAAIHKMKGWKEGGEEAEGGHGESGRAVSRGRLNVADESETAGGDGANSSPLGGKSRVDTLTAPELTVDSIPESDFKDDTHVIGPQSDEDEEKFLNAVLEKQMESLVQLSMEALSLGIGEPATGDSVPQAEVEKELESLLQEERFGDEY